jgi:hypothetical protein
LQGTAELGLALVALVLLGAVAGRWAERAAASGANVARGRLEFLVSNVMLPALVFAVVGEARIDEIASFPFALAGMAASYLAFMVMFVVAATLAASRFAEATMQGAAASYGGIGYLGVPVVYALLGSQAALAAVLMLVSVTLLHAVLLPVLHVLARPRAPARATLRGAGAIVADPLLAAVAAGTAFAWSGAAVPAVVAGLLDYLTAAAVPMALFAFGASLGRGGVASADWKVAVAALVKLVASPFITLSLLLAVGGYGEAWLAAAVLVAAMPTAVQVERLAGRWNIYAGGASSCLALSGLVSLFTVPLTVWLIGEGAIGATAAFLFGR